MVKTLLFRNLLTILVIAGGYVFLWFSAETNSDHSYTLCVVKNVTGYPCPGCGMGRASIELFKGNIAESLHFHWWAIPFHILVWISLIWLIRDIIIKKDTFRPFIQRPMNTVWLGLIFILVLINWIRAIYIGL